MHLISVNWQAKCGRQLGQSPKRFCNSHGLNQLSTDSYKMHGQHVDVWSSFRGLTPANLHQNNSIPLKFSWTIATIKLHLSPSQKRQKRCISQSPWIAIFEAKKPHLVFFLPRPPKTACFLELPRELRNAGRESGANPKGALPFQSHLLSSDMWQVDIDVSSSRSFSKMYDYICCIRKMTRGNGSSLIDILLN